LKVFLRGRQAVLMAALMIVAIASSGCSNDGRTYKIGLLLPLTGRGGPQAREAVRLQQKEALKKVEDLNARGGIDGHPVRLIIYDTAADRARTLVAAKRLLEVDYALAVIYPGWGGMSPAIEDLFKKGRTPLLYHDYSGEYTDAPNEWIDVLWITLPPGEAAMHDAVVNAIDKSLESLFDAISRSGIDKARINSYISG